MRKIISIIIVIILLTITGCSSKEVIRHNYVYKGENELWTAEYKVNGTGTFSKKDGTLHYESKSNKILTVTYKKDLSLLSAVKHLEISYESSTGGGKITEDYNDNPPNEKTYTLKSSSTGEGGEIEDKNEIIKVIINIDGKMQTIELRML